MGPCSFFVFNRLVAAHKGHDYEPGSSGLRRPETR